MDRVVSKKSTFIGSILLALILGGCTTAYQRESTSQFFENTAITAQVKAKLLADPEIESLPITVKSYKNQVQLSGFVNSSDEVQRAMRIARSVPGVTSVKNSLIVKEW